MKTAAPRFTSKAALALMGLLLLGVLTGCSGGGSSSGNNGAPAAAPEFLYVSDTIGQLFAFSIDANSGALSLLGNGRPGDVVGVGFSGVVRLAADPDGTDLYVSRAQLDGGPNLLVLNLRPGASPGSLAQGPTQTLTVSPGKLAVDPTGKNLYAIPDPSANQPEIMSFAITSGTFQSGGATLNTHFLTALPTPVTAVPGVPQEITVDPSGHYVYVTFAGAAGAQVAGYSRDQTTGALTNLPNSPFGNTGGNNAQGIRFTPNGSFAVVANAATNNVSVMSFDSATGTLTNIGGSPFAAGTSPISVAIDPSSKFVFVANEGDNTLSAYAIGAAGGLTAITGSPFTVASRPQAVTVVSGQFVYIATADGNVLGFTLNTGTGTLTPITGSPFHLNVTVDATTGFCVQCGAELRDIVVLKP